MFASSTPARAKPKEKEYDLLDDDGLVLRVRPNGRKVWYVFYYIGKKRTKKKIGEFPLMSLSEARTERDVLKMRVRSGLSAVDMAAAPFKDLGEEWFSMKKASRLSEIHLKNIRYRLDNYIYAGFGEISTADLTRPVMTQPLIELVAAGKRETAKRVACIIAEILDYAVDRGYIQGHNGAHLSKALPAQEVKHFAHITNPSVIGHLLAALDRSKMSAVSKACILINLYCFPRIGEQLLSTWDEIDLRDRIWTIPAEHTKRRRVHIVPLSSQASQIFEMLQKECKRIYGTDSLQGRLIYPTTYTAAKRIAAIRENAILKSLKNLHMYDPAVPMTISIHGFRHTASTFLYRMGENTMWIEKQLAHLDPNRIRATYNQYEFLEERRNMLQRYADYIDSLRIVENTGLDNLPR